MAFEKNSQLFDLVISTLPMSEPVSDRVVDATINSKGEGVQSKFMVCNLACRWIPKLQNCCNLVCLRTILYYDSLCQVAVGEVCDTSANLLGYFKFSWTFHPLLSHDSTQHGKEWYLLMTQLRTGAVFLRRTYSCTSERVHRNSITAKQELPSESWLLK